MFIGRERHVENGARGSFALSAAGHSHADYLYIINFRPERFPLGDPYRLDGSDPPTAQQIASTTFVTLPDEDAGPTKAWLVTHRADEKWKPLFEHAYGRRPREELFDLNADPHQMHNVAGDAKYADVRKSLEAKLLAELRSTGDPRHGRRRQVFRIAAVGRPAAQ